jgi:(p)ppGpp synthase/HD superfamily hydrolase
VTTPLLKHRFTEAVEYARQIHSGIRKGTQVPYMAHLLGVASLVLGETGHVPFPVTEDEAIGALLHDAVEDCGGHPRLRDIEGKFGSAVAQIVEGCSDSFAENPSDKAPWKGRKLDYLRRLPHEPPNILLVSLADKLYNVRSMVEDYRAEGDRLWERFSQGRAEQLWYFQQLIKVFDPLCPTWRLLLEFKDAVAALEVMSDRKGDG